MPRTVLVNCVSGRITANTHAQMAAVTDLVSAHSSGKFHRH